MQIGPEMFSKCLSLALSQILGSPIKELKGLQAFFVIATGLIDECLSNA